MSILSNAVKTNHVNVRPKKIRRPQPAHAAKTHWVYNIDDVCKLYGVSRNTPANWVKLGLCKIDERRDMAFKGSELNRFHKQHQESAKSTLGPNNIFCVACGEAKLPHPSPISLRKSRRGTITINSVCPNCTRPISRFVAAIDVS
jgi:hypothetical protein